MSCISYSYVFSSARLAPSPIQFLLGGEYVERMHAVNHYYSNLPLKNNKEGTWDCTRCFQ